MADFFQDIVNYKLFNQWAETLDWLTNDKRFDKSTGWDSGATKSFTAKIKRLPYFPRKSYNHQPVGAGKIIFPQTVPDAPTIYMYKSKSDSESREIVRHIRNGIAHGQTRIISQKGTLYIEIKDYKDDSKTIQTAYLYMPMDFILRLHELYKEVLKTKQHKNMSNKKTKKKG